MSAFVAAVVVALLSASAPVPAQQWSAEQQEVWAIVTETWTLDMNEEDWAGQYMHDEGFGWGSDNPMPRNKDRTRSWNRFNDETTEVFEWETHPLAIIVHGDTAVAHYYASWAERNANGEMENQHYKFTDVLVREGGDWLYIAWHGSKTAQD